MYAHFPLFHSHLDLAHSYWKKLLKPGDIVVDATCGNGHDTVVLAELALTSDAGILFALDIQPRAIESCRQRVSDRFSKDILERVCFVEGCHSQFPKDIAPDSLKLVVYNLGYLPGGNKAKTTTSTITLRSVQEAQRLLLAGGVISITCYPGHDAGKIEEEELVEFAKGLDPLEWSACHHRWTNRKDSPSLLLLQRR